MKERLDVLLVKRNLAASREKAKAIIMSGNVYVDNQKEVNQEQRSQKNLRLKCVAIHCLMSAAADLS